MLDDGAKPNRDGARDFAEIKCGHASNLMAVTLKKYAGAVAILGQYYYRHDKASAVGVGFPSPSRKCAPNWPDA